MPELASVTEVDGQERQGQERQEMARCFKCPRERGRDEPGWYFLDPSKLRGSLRRHVVFVCPAHYDQFAAAERARWDSLCDPILSPGMPPLASAEPPVGEPMPPVPVPPTLAPADARDAQPSPFAGEMILPAPIIAAT